MDISKHKVMKEIHEAMGMVEDLGCSEKLTALSVKLGEIAETAEILVDGKIAMDKCAIICG